MTDFPRLVTALVMRRLASALEALPPPPPLALEAVPDTDATPAVEEICDDLAALTYVRKQLRAPKGLSLSMRLLNETHRRRLAHARGRDRRSGEVRTSQN